MRDDRILTGDIREFFETNSPMRDLIANYVLENLKNGTRSVALCFRGNFATLYYRCHQLLRIRNARRGILCEFDFRHARFTENYRDILARLRGLGVDDSDFSDAPNAQGRYVRFALSEFGAEQLERVLDLYKALIDDFVDPAKQKYMFDPRKPRGKSKNIEKDRQQQLYAAHFLSDDLMYYDLEYAEPRGAQKDGLHGRFDLLGLRREQDGFSLLLTELKSSPQALGGRSGVAEHERDYLRYLDSKFIEFRKREACETVRLINKIFGRQCFADLTPDKIASVKVQFVFSDSVIGAGKAYHPSDDRIEKVYLENKKLLQKTQG